MTSAPTGTADRRRATASARARRGPTAPSRCAASSRTPPTCGPTACCGARPCAARIPRARIRGIDTAAALAVPGVYAVLTHEDVPGAKRYGLEHRDQPVLADDQVRYQGEPVALVAADHPETARRAAALIVVAYEVLAPVTDAAGGGPSRGRAAAPGRQHRAARPVRARRPVGRPPPWSWSPASTRSACRTRRSSARSRGWRCRPRTAASTCTSRPSGCTSTGAGRRVPRPATRTVRLTLAGVGGAFGAREDLSMQVHACLLALRTGRPVKMVYSREESFFGHVHRHPAWMRYEHGADRDGRLVYVRAESCSTAVPTPRARRRSSPTPRRSASARTRYPTCAIDATGPTPTTRRAARCAGSARCRPLRVRVADGPAGRGVGLDPVEIRVRNAMAEGDRIATGQVVDSRRSGGRDAAPGAGPAAPAPTGPRTSRSLPGGVGQHHPRRGRAARRRVRGRHQERLLLGGLRRLLHRPGAVEVVGGEPVVMVHTAAAEVGQGLVTVQAQIARTELGVEQVASRPPTPGRLGGLVVGVAADLHDRGAVQAACRAVAAELLARASTAWPARRELVRSRTVTWSARPAAGSPGRRAGRRRRPSRRPSSGGTGRPRRWTPDRAGRRPRAVRLRRAPGHRRRGHRTGPGEGGGARHRAGRRAGDQPRRGRSGRSTAAPRRASGWR